MSKCSWKLRFIDYRNSNYLVSSPYEGKGFIPFPNALNRNPILSKSMIQTTLKTRWESLPRRQPIR
ncbi:MAG: hypothetical protein AB1394_06030 [Bacteroidota bacterium]